LHDLHGNAAEWLLSNGQSHPIRSNDGRNIVDVIDRKVARNGSFFDPSKRCRSTFRLDFSVWQRTFNVGLRIVCEDDIEVTQATEPGR